MKKLLYVFAVALIAMVGCNCEENCSSKESCKKDSVECVKDGEKCCKKDGDAKKCCSKDAAEELGCKGGGECLPDHSCCLPAEADSTASDSTAEKSECGHDHSKAADHDHADGQDHGHDHSDGEDHGHEH